MNSRREHSSKNVLMSFRDGEYWEAWKLRFDLGNKRHKPVQHNALSTPYFACDDKDWRLDDLYKKIMGAWRDT
jgi:hypothetical protein